MVSAHLLQGFPAAQWSCGSNIGTDCAELTNKQEENVCVNAFLFGQESYRIGLKTWYFNGIIILISKQTQTEAPLYPPVHRNGCLKTLFMKQGIFLLCCKTDVLNLYQCWM